MKRGAVAAVGMPRFFAGVLARRWVRTQQSASSRSVSFRGSRFRAGLRILNLFFC
jgi:hypothetical protein